MTHPALALKISRDLHVSSASGYHVSSSQLEIVKCDPELFLRRISPQIDRRSRLR